MTYLVEPTNGGLELFFEAVVREDLSVLKFIDADFTYDFQEGDYLREVATALGAPEDEYRSHIVKTVRLKKIDKSQL